MKTQFKMLLVRLMCLLLAFQPLAQAQTRQDVQNHPELASDLDSKVYDLRAYYLEEYSRIKSASQFVQVFGAKQSAAEKAKVEKILSQLEHLPKMEPIENGVRLTLDGLVFNIDLKSLDKKQVIINGVNFSIDLSAPWTLQAEILTRKLESQKGNKYGLFYSLMVPQAEAVVLTIVKTAASLIGLGFVNTLISRYSAQALDIVDWSVCQRAKEANSKLLENPFFCAGSKKEWEKTAKEDPSVNAAKIALTTGKKAEIFSTDEKTEICPQASGGKLYQSVISKYGKQPEKPTAGKNQSKEQAKIDDPGLESIGILTAELDGQKLKSATYSELIPVDKKGNPIRKGKDGKLHLEKSKDGKDLFYVDSKGKPVTTLMVTYKMDAESQLNEIRVPSSKVPPLLKDQLAGANELVIKTTSDLENQPLLKNLKETELEIFQHLADRLSYCKAQDKEAKGEQAKDTASANANKASSSKAAK